MKFLPTQAALEAQALEHQRASRGRAVAFSNLAHRAHVTRMFSQEVVSIATNGEATIVLYEREGWAWSTLSPKPRNPKPFSFFLTLNPKP